MSFRQVAQAEHRRIVEAEHARLLAEEEARKEDARRQEALQRQQEADAEYLRRIEFEEREAAAAWRKFILSFDLSRVWAYRYAVELAERPDRKPIYFTSSALSGTYLASREEARRDHLRAYKALHDLAGHNKTPVASDLKIPTPDEAETIIAAWQKTEDGRRMIALAQRCALIRKYIERLDAGDQPTRGEIAEARGN